ncbi:MAG: zinc-ribbon domain-containing protein [Deltaproteobacteria bacterium]|nr:zinc-ribbon domain-containing protein [Deltaproteobacteria bacterium]
MIKVICDSCNASYDLDEKRIPPKGMKMRCPKCQASLIVTPLGKAGAQPQSPASETIAGLGPQREALKPPPPPVEKSARAKSSDVNRKNAPETLFGSPPIPGEAKKKPLQAKTVLGIGEPKAEDRTATKASFRISQQASEEEIDLPALKEDRALEKAGISQEDRTNIDETDLPGLPKIVSEKRKVFLDSSLDVSDSGEVDLPGLPIRGNDSGTKRVSLTIDEDEAGFDDAGLYDLPAVKSHAREQTLARKNDTHETSFAEIDLENLPAPKKVADLSAKKPLWNDDDMEGDFGRDIDHPIAARERSISRLPSDSDAAQVRDEEAFGLPRLKQSEPIRARSQDGASEIETLDLPKLMRPEVEAEAPILKEGFDLPRFKRESGVDDDFGTLELPLPKPESTRPRSAKHGTAQGYPSPSPPKPDNQTEVAGEFELPDEISFIDEIASVKPPRIPSMPAHAKRASRASSDDTQATVPQFSAPPKANGFSDEPLDLAATRLQYGGENFSDRDGGREDFRAKPTPSSPGEIGPHTAQSEALMGGELDWGARSERPEKQSEATDALGRTGIGGASFGEVDLGADGIGGLDGGLMDESQFAAPDLDTDALARTGLGLPPDVLRRQRGLEYEARREARARKTLKRVIKVGAALLVLAIAGVALGLTEYGIFGIYFVERYLPSAGTPAFAREAIRKAESTAVSDTYRDVRKSLTLLGKARASAGLNRELLTRSLVHESLFLVRFGQDSASSARAAAIFARLDERRRKAAGIELALAADALRRTALPEAEEHLNKARGQAASDVYLELVAGELALSQNRLKTAKQAFEKAIKMGGGARAQWGLARVVIRDGRDPDTRAEVVDETLRLSPRHSDARIAYARILIERGQEEKAQQLLLQAVGMEAVDNTYLWVSRLSKAEGYSVLGYLLELKGRLTKARESYDRALCADPFRIEALLGAGQVALREQRYSEASARFEAAFNTAKTTDPIVFSGRRASVDAELGIGRALLMLSRATEARDRLEKLAEGSPNDAEIILWLGKTMHALGKEELAEKNYRRSIALKPDEFEGYLELAQLFFTLKKPEEASVVLNEAAANVAESAEMRRMLGQSELARNRIDNAIHEFRRAIELDPEDLHARFGLGVALRRNGDLAEAQKMLHHVAQRDPAFSGLPVENGRLFEAQGDYIKAVQSYRSALERDPGNTDLMLRLGAAQVEANNLEAATETLNKVVEAIPNSAEAEHLIGRIAFARGRTPDALVHFDRAVSLDGTRAEYHLYAGRAALEMSNLGRTLEESQAAIDRDPSIGDAFRLRGIVRLKTGAVQDALEDLKRALVLSPNRFETYAAIGDCHEEMRKLKDAADAYRKALEFDPNNARYWYRLGALLLDSSRANEALQALKRATSIGDAIAQAPAWLADAHLLAGNILRVSGKREAAVAHYDRYLEIASPTAIDREEVEKNLQRWGIKPQEK